VSVLGPVWGVPRTLQHLGERSLERLIARMKSGDQIPAMWKRVIENQLRNIETKASQISKLQAQLLAEKELVASLTLKLANKNKLPPAIPPPIGKIRNTGEVGLGTVCDAVLGGSGSGGEIEAVGSPLKSKGKGKGKYKKLNRMIDTAAD